MNKLKSLLTLMLVLNSYLLISQSLFEFSDEKEKIDNSSFEFTNANAFNIELEELKVLDVKTMFRSSRVWNVIFLDDKHQMVYVREGQNVNENDIVVQDIVTSKIIAKFRGSNLIAVSPDGNRIYYDNHIYDIKQQKTFEINPNFNGAYLSGTSRFWLDDNKIIAYKNTTINGVVKPYNKFYYYLDLDDLTYKKMDDQEINRVFLLIQSSKSKHQNFYLNIYGTRDILIKDLKTPFSKSILFSPNGHPINAFWSSKNLEYLVVSKHSQRYTNSSELVLYKLKSTIDTGELNLFFSATNPYKWLDDDFKVVFNQTNGVGIWADVYEAKINPLNNKLLGPDMNKHKGTIRIVKNIGNDMLGLMLGSGKEKIKSGYVISNFRKDKYTKDSGGAWATLSEWDFLENCSIDFTKLTIGKDDINVLKLHSILNKDKSTIVAKTGVNSPGNETSLFVEETTQALLKYQKLKGLNQTGVIDIPTSKELNKTCSILSKIDKLKEIK